MVAPRVLFANLLLGYHGWPTRHRTGGGKYSKCPICGANQDYTAHLILCPPVKQAIYQFLPPLNFEAHKRCALLCARDMSLEEVVIFALFNFANYTVSNLNRHNAFKGQVSASILIEHASLAASAHARSQNIWSAINKRKKHLTLVAAPKAAAGPPPLRVDGFFQLPWASREVAAPVVNKVLPCGVGAPSLLACVTKV